MQQQIGPTSVFGRVLDPKNKDGILTQIEQCVEKQVQEKLDDMLGQFSLDDEKSAMSRFHKLLHDSFAQIHQTLGIKAATAIEAERGHVKGMEFKQTSTERSPSSAAGSAISRRTMRGTPGTSRKKTGDYLSTLGDECLAPGVRLVVLSKEPAGQAQGRDRRTARGKEKPRSEQRIYVFAKGCEPPEVGDFRRVGEDFFCTVDKDQLGAGDVLIYLEAAYQIARASSIAAARKGEVDALDLQKLLDHVNALVSCTERLAEISTKARTVKNSGEAIEKIADAAKTELAGRLSEMKGMLHAGTAE